MMFNHKTMSEANDLIPVDEYARRMAGNWERENGYFFMWEKTFDSIELARDVACITLWNEQCGMALKSNAVHIKNQLELLLERGNLYPDDWFVLENETCSTGVGLMCLYIRVYYPGTRMITKAFYKFYDLCKRGNQFVFERTFNPRDTTVKALNLELFQSLQKEDDLLVIGSSSWSYLRRFPSDRETEWLYQWMKESVDDEPFMGLFVNSEMTNRELKNLEAACKEMPEMPDESR